jgi:sortase A
MMPRSFWPVVEGACWAVGLASIAFYFVAVAYGEVERRDAIEAFTGAYSAPDRTTWSPARIAAHEASVASGSLPVAVLRIARVDLEVPVFADATERNLNRGAGLIEGTARPGNAGNVGIAAHRDGYFRALREVSIGDVIELDSPEAQVVYRVSELSIVDPTDIRPLDETDMSSITLVTCYPFYFAGSAPKRYIVRAVLQSETGVSQ